MNNLKLKNQSLILAVDFKRRAVFGSTVLSSSVAVPISLLQLFQTLPPSDLQSSGFTIPLQCPPPNICNVSSVEIGGVPATFHWDTKPQMENLESLTPNNVYDLLTFDEAVNSFLYQNFRNSTTDCKLLIEIPPLSLHRAASKLTKQKSGDHNSTDVIRGSLVADTTTIPFKLSVTFSLTNISPSSSLIYFTTHTLREEYGKLVRYPLLVTSTQAMRERCWFPTIPTKNSLISQGGKQKRSGYVIPNNRKGAITPLMSVRGRCGWKCQFTVPEGMLAVGTGMLCRRRTHFNSEGQFVETFYYETRGPLSAIPPTQICLFVGYFSCISGNQEPDGILPRNKIENEGDKGLTEERGVDSDSEGGANDPKAGDEERGVRLHGSEAGENRKRNKSSSEGLRSVKRKSSKTMKININSDNKTYESGGLGSPGIPITAFITLKGFESRLLCVTPIVTGTIKALCETYNIDYPHPQLMLLFLPIGSTGLCLGTGVWDPGTCLEDAIANPALGSAYCLFGGTVVLDFSLLHSVTENHPKVFRSQELIADGILSILFGGVWDVPISDVSRDYWLLVAFRRLALETFIKESVGHSHLVAMNWLRLELFSRFVELGYDTHALCSEIIELGSSGYLNEIKEESKFMDNNWDSPLSPFFNLKASFIFPSLDVLLSSPRSNPPRACCNEFDSSSTRWSPPIGTLQQYLIQTVSHAAKRGPGHLISTKRFLEKLQRRLKQVFITTGAWRALKTTSSATVITSSEFPNRLNEQTKIIPTVETLDLNLYANTPSINIGRLLEDVSGFVSSWILGVGCSAISIGMFLQLQRKAATPIIDSLILNYDEYPLQPPSPLDSYTGISETNGAMLSATGALEILLEEASTIDTQQENLANSEIVKEKDFYSDLANQDLSSLLLEYEIDLPFLSPTTYELIVKDHGTGLGFGYVGRDATALTHGDGNLFHVLQSRLAADWGSLDQDQRVALTADIPTRLAVLHSNPNENAKYLPLSSPPPYPLWMLPSLSSIILRDLIKYPAHLGRIKAIRQNIVPYLTCLISRVHGEDLSEEGTEVAPNKADISTPLSIGFGKYYVDLITIHVCTEHSVLQHPKFLQDHDLPMSIDVRAVEAAVVRTTKAGGGGTDRWNSGAGSRLNRRFCGTLSSIDEILFTGDSGAGLVEGGSQRKSHDGSKSGKKEKTKHLPILWLRIMGETRPIWLARIFRCQSVGMWEQQLVNDNLINSKLEAADAMGYISSVYSVVPRLAWTLRDHRIHPLIRSISARSLQKLHNNRNSFHSKDCCSALLNYLYTYHYKHQVAHHKIEHTEGDEAKGNSQKSEGTVIPKTPPYWLTSEMILLKDILTAVSRLSGMDGRTPFESLDALSQPLTYQRTDVKATEAVSTDNNKIHHQEHFAIREVGEIHNNEFSHTNAEYYSAHLIKCLGNVCFPYTYPQQVIEIMATPGLLHSFVHGSIPSASRLNGPSANHYGDGVGKNHYHQEGPETLVSGESIMRSIEKDWNKWRESIDADAEALFLNVWRYYRLDICLHSADHVITRACLRVLSQNSTYRDLTRIKYCDELRTDFQLMAFLPINFTPFLLALLPWVKGPSNLESRMTSAGCFAHTVCLNSSGAALAKAQFSIEQQISTQIKQRKAAAVAALSAASPNERLKHEETVRETAKREMFYNIVGCGIKHLVNQMMSHFLTCCDRSVEKEAIRSLLYCCAVGALEPPLILLLHRAPQALSDFHNFEDIAEYLEVTLEMTSPSEARYSSIWKDIKIALLPILRENSRQIEEPGVPLWTFADSGKHTGSNKIPGAMEYVARCLFCCRWTSYDESVAIQRSGLSILNSVMLACRLEELLTGYDVVELLPSIWESMIEILGDISRRSPLALMPYWLKQYRYMENMDSEKQNERMMAQGLRSTKRFLPRWHDLDSCNIVRPRRVWETFNTGPLEYKSDRNTLSEVQKLKKLKKRKKQKSKQSSICREKNQSNVVLEEMKAFVLQQEEQAAAEGEKEQRLRHASDALLERQSQVQLSPILQPLVDQCEITQHMIGLTNFSVPLPEQSILVNDHSPSFTGEGSAKVKGKKNKSKKVKKSKKPKRHEQDLERHTAFEQISVSHSQSSEWTQAENLESSTAPTFVNSIASGPTMTSMTSHQHITISEELMVSMEDIAGEGQIEDFDASELRFSNEDYEDISTPWEDQWSVPLSGHLVADCNNRSDTPAGTELSLDINQTEIENNRCMISGDETKSISRDSDAHTLEEWEQTPQDILQESVDSGVLFDRISESEGTNLEPQFQDDPSLTMTPPPPNSNVFGLVNDDRNDASHPQPQQRYNENVQGVEHPFESLHFEEDIEKCDHPDNELHIDSFPCHPPEDIEMDNFEHVFEEELMDDSMNSQDLLAMVEDENFLVGHIFDEPPPIYNKGEVFKSASHKTLPERSDMLDHGSAQHEGKEKEAEVLLTDWWNFIKKEDKIHSTSSYSSIEGTPVLECAELLWDYLNSRAGRIPCIADLRIALVKQVYIFLFGYGVPSCIASQYSPEKVLTPDPSLIDGGRFLKRLCQFHRRYQDDNADIPEWQSVAVEITELLMELPIAGPFIDKVDPKEAPNYEAIIKEPMWLKLVHEKLQAHQYMMFEDWKNDLFLIFRNCRIFNTSESAIFRDCEALQNILYSLLKPTVKLLRKKEAKQKQKINIPYSLR